METESEFVRTLDKYVQEFNANDTWRQGYMKFELMMRDNYKNGRAEGLAESLAEGLAEGRTQGRAQAEAQIVKNMYSKQISLETIADCTQLSLAEVQKIISTKQQQFSQQGRSGSVNNFVDFQFWQYKTMKCNTAGTG